MEQTPVSFTIEWASQMRDVRSFSEFQRAAGSPGRITVHETASETPRVIYAWNSPAGAGHMRAFLYADGAFAAIITTAVSGEVILNSAGAFVCPGCTPPVNACGTRPSWVPHSVHWDTFDCDHTLSGPQSLYDRDRR